MEVVSAGYTTVIAPETAFVALLFVVVSVPVFVGTVALANRATGDDEVAELR
ncbi:hypothetical protein [Halobellus ruber]|uniref:Uncharacterized protein n=1 Tax=Halobellus ruber TaxID=2761102 RepID=A0A7J9SIV3_9EURY|nr:hypothetical protein [Halobellus ruber]MBB6645956.1 hypothetical protein [Halobellus ruber]